MNSANREDLLESVSSNGDGGGRPADEALEIVRAIKGGEVDAVIVEESGKHELMALARLTDLDEINELIRALRSGEVDAFIADEGDGQRVYSVTPIHEILAQQYNLTKTITDNATTALFITDANQKCVFMNPAAEALTGYAFDEAKGRTLHELVHHTRRDGTPCPLSECPIDQAFPTQSQMTGEEVFVHKDGHFYEVGFTASPIREISGEAVGTVIEARNITRRKTVERALLEADQRKDEFIATLAHELRNPLAPISNLLELMKSAENNAAVQRNARETIERQLTKIVRLVDDLLDVSRISRNAIELKLAPIELGLTFEDVIDTCTPMIEQHGHSLRLMLPDEPIYLNADSARISQVLCNLINNACKYTPAGGNLEVSAIQRGNAVEIRVKDSGIGIPREQLNTIFQMFAQVRGPLTDPRGGLGIGLALARQLVEMHGGSITAHSDGEWTGSEFVIWLPVMNEIPAERTQPETHAPLPTEWRILVVDDNYDSAESMGTLLSMSGNECMMAHDGSAAIALAESFKPDVMLLDIGLPEMDGYEVCRTIRKQDWGRSITIIAMTGWGQAEDRQRSKDAGFSAHLVKPVDISKLNALLASKRQDDHSAGSAQ